MQKDSIFELKQQARRLRDALSDLQKAGRPVEVTHVEALNLVARSRGYRTWEALEQARQAPPPVTLPCANATTAALDAWRNPGHPEFLQVHARSLASSFDYAGYTLADLEAVVRATFDAATANEVVRQPYTEQVKALFQRQLGTLYRGAPLPADLARGRVSAQLAKQAPGRRCRPHAFDAKLRTWWMAQLAQELERQDFEPADLDGLVYDLIGGKKASVINNQGLQAQLMAIFDALRKGSKVPDLKVRDQLMARICAECQDFKPLAEFSNPPLGLGY